MRASRKTTLVLLVHYTDNTELVYSCNPEPWARVYRAGASHSLPGWMLLSMFTPTVRSTLGAAWEETAARLACVPVDVMSASMLEAECPDDELACHVSDVQPTNKRRPDELHLHFLR